MKLTLNEFFECGQFFVNLSLTLQLLCGARACMCVFVVCFYVCECDFVYFFSLFLTHSHILHLTVDVILGNLATQLTQNEWLTNEKSFAPIQIRTICFANTQIIIINNFDVDFICDSIWNDQLFKIFNSDSNESFYWW